MNKVTKESEESVMTKNLKTVTRDGGMGILAIGRKCRRSGRCEGYNELCVSDVSRLGFQARPY